MVTTAIVDPVSPAAPLEVILGRMYGQPIFDMPKDLYIPPDALEVILDAFEGPLGKRRKEKKEKRRREKKEIRKEEK